LNRWNLLSVLSSINNVLPGKPNNNKAGSRDCPLCCLATPFLNKHHMIHLTRHKNKRVQKHVYRNDMIHRVFLMSR